jgi:hypothetical protein
MTDRETVNDYIGMRLCCDCKFSNSDINSEPCSLCILLGSSPDWQPGEELLALINITRCDHDFEQETPSGDLKCKRCGQIYRRLSS